MTEGFDLVSLRCFGSGLGAKLLESSLVLIFR